MPFGYEIAHWVVLLQCRLVPDHSSGDQWEALYNFDHGDMEAAAAQIAHSVANTHQTDH